jgi:hypothetical protein
LDGARLTSYLWKQLRTNIYKDKNSIFGFGAWIPGIIFSFVYNKINIKELLEKGYRPVDEQTQAELKSRGIISDSSVSV